MICIYQADCKDFSGNGRGGVTPQFCTATETLNGSWLLVHPIDEMGNFTEMQAAAQEQFPAGCDLPDVTLQVDFINSVGIGPLQRGSMG